MRHPVFHRSLSAALAIALALGGSGCDKLSSMFGNGGGGSALTPATPEAIAAASTTPGGKVHPISTADFNAHAQVPDRLVVVDFYADWCGPCKELAPILESLSTEFPSNVLFLKMDVDDNKALAKKLGVRGIPDLRFFLNGQQVDSMIGAGSTQEIRQKISSHAPVPKAASEVPVAEGNPPATPPRSGIFGLVDKTRAGMEQRAEQADLQPNPPAAPPASAKGKVAPPNPPAAPPAPASPAIRPVKANEDQLPAGMSRSTRP